jgi:hypothetical protein
MSSTDATPLMNATSAHASIGTDMAAQILAGIADVAREQRSQRNEITGIRESLASGGTQLESVKNVPVEMATLKEQVATLRQLVYGAVAAALLGLLGTAGMALLYVISMMAQTRMLPVMQSAAAVAP